MTNPIDVGLTFRESMITASRSLFAADTHVLVTSAVINVAAEDIVLIGPVAGARSAEDNLSGSNRTQDWDLELEVTCYSTRLSAESGEGEQAIDQEAFDAASGLLSRLAEYVRRSAPYGDTTLGGAVMWCRLEDFVSEPGRAQAASGTGRMWEFTGKFVAKQRVTG